MAKCTFIYLSVKKEINMVSVYKCTGSGQLTWTGQLLADPGYGTSGLIAIEKRVIKMVFRILSVDLKKPT